MGLSLGGRCSGCSAGPESRPGIEVRSWAREGPPGFGEVGRRPGWRAQVVVTLANGVASDDPSDSGSARATTLNSSRVARISDAVVVVTPLARGEVISCGHGLAWAPSPPSATWCWSSRTLSAVTALAQHIRPQGRTSVQESIPFMWLLRQTESGERRQLASQQREVDEAFVDADPAEAWDLVRRRQ